MLDTLVRRPLLEGSRHFRAGNLAKQRYFQTCSLKRVLKKPILDEPEHPYVVQRSAYISADRALL